MSIRFESVTKRFGEATVALSEVSFVVDPGELVIITGPSGSGKTTVMRLIIREYTPEEGKIFFDDKSLAELRSGQIPHHRRQIGVVFQDYKLLPELNVWENIALPLSIIGKDEAETESRVTDLLKLVGLADKAWLFPSQLSGGEAQRISIARALATGPSLIFADEPTGNLDPSASLEIVKLLRQINRLGTTILIATHDAVVLEFLKSERQLELKHGELVHDSRPQTKPARNSSKVEADEEVEADQPKKVTEVKKSKPESDEPEETEIEDLDDDKSLDDEPTKKPKSDSKLTSKESKPEKETPKSHHRSSDSAEKTKKTVKKTHAVT